MGAAVEAVTVTGAHPLTAVAPDMSSDNTQDSDTGPRYHPLLPAGPEIDGVTTGGVVSIFNVAETVVVSPAPFVAVQVSVWPAVFCVSVTDAQPALVLAMPDSGSLVVQVTVTADVYQLFDPSVPLTTGVTTGG